MAKEKIRVFTIGTKRGDGDIHPGNVEEVSRAELAMGSAHNRVYSGEWDAAYVVAVSQDGNIHSTSKVSVSIDRQGAWEDGTRITPSQVWDAARNYIAAEEAEAKRTDEAQV